MTAQKALRLLIMAAGIGVGNPAAAQDFSLNYERLSSLEAPLATEVGDVTFVLTGLLDAPFVLDLDKSDDRDADIIGNFQISALAQLPNRWRIGLSYFGQYATDEPPGTKPGEKYEDNAALSIGGVWGTVMGGNVSGIVREQTRRLRGAGNASPAFDDVLGGGYVGRVSARGLSVPLWTRMPISKLERCISARSVLGITG